MESYKKGGLHPRKYIITKTNGNPVDPEADYFVLRLDKGDTHAQKALAKYADSVEEDNEELAADLAEKLHDYGWEKESPTPSGSADIEKLKLEWQEHNRKHLLSWNEIAELVNQVAATSRPNHWDLKQLRILVDMAWNDATESTEVPSTARADKIINDIKPTPDKPGPVVNLEYELKDIMLSLEREISDYEHLKGASVSVERKNYFKGKWESCRRYHTILGRMIGWLSLDVAFNPQK